jgi:hypothetical protein
LVGWLAPKPDDRVAKEVFPSAVHRLAADGYGQTVATCRQTVATCRQTVEVF